MTERQQRPRRTVHTGRVERVERLTPHMVRVVLGGEGLSGFATDGSTDSYVKLLFPPPAHDDPEDFDLDAVRAERPRSEWPVTRTFTVRSWDAGELTIDFVYHGEVGLAGVWAAAARPGDRLRLLGPGGGFAPDAGADWHLLAGDESALPAIAASVEALPEGRPAHVFVEVDDPAEEQHLTDRPDVRVTWLHRHGGVPGSLLVPAVRSLELPSGEVRAFVHGEANFVRDLRRLLRVELGLPKEHLSVSGYWRLGRDEDGWQASKPEWNRSVEAEEAAALGSS